VPSFDRIRCRRHDADVLLYAFDLIELGKDQISDIVGRRLMTYTKDFSSFPGAMAIICQISDSFTPLSDGH
jgi:hypothetical protein